jgi:hypothetical protein
VTAANIVVPPVVVNIVDVAAETHAVLDACHTLHCSAMKTEHDVAMVFQMVELQTKMSTYKQAKFLPY